MYPFQKFIFNKRLFQDMRFILMSTFAVGAGSAGCVLANRLSENKHVTVLLLEAGPDDRKYPNVSVPGFAESLYHTEIDWEYFTEPQQFALQGFEENVSSSPKN